MIDLDRRVRAAVKHFWKTRSQQATRTGSRDKGGRSAVTGGEQMAGFVSGVREILMNIGLPAEGIFESGGDVQLPGFFRPTKKWDLLVVRGGQLLAAMEFKSQVGPSFGNNFNNRTEEALGSATGIWTAYREGVFKPSARPWLGYLILLEQVPRSIRPVAVSEPHFKVLPEFKGASYAKRYELLCQKLARERHYDATCLILSDPQSGPNGSYTEPNVEFSFEALVTSLTAKILSHLGGRNK